MYKTIASRLTAQFNVDGSHLQMYLYKSRTITKSLCEDLILHDQILIPTPDFLTADGLILTVGENAFIELLENNRIKFIRTRSVLCYVRGTGKDGGLAVFSDPNNKRPQDSPVDESVAAGLSVIQDRIKEKKKIEYLLNANTIAEETSSILDKVRRESVADLKETHLWKPKYNFPKPGLLALPGMAKMQCRVIGSEHDPVKRIVDTLLSLVVYNSDLYLAEKYDCDNISPFYPIGDLVRLKAHRIDSGSEGLWELFEINGIPDLSLVNLAEGSLFKDFHKVTQNGKADTFRKWFHALKSFDRLEILKEYISIIQEVPWTQKLPAKVFRFAATTGLGLIPGVGQLASIFDTFVLDRLFRKASPKYFIDDLNQVTGKMDLQPSAGTAKLHSA